MGVQQVNLNAQMNEFIVKDWVECTLGPFNGAAVYSFSLSHTPRKSEKEEKMCTHGGTTTHLSCKKIQACHHRGCCFRVFVRYIRCLYASIYSFITSASLPLPLTISCFHSTLHRSDCPSSFSTLITRQGENSMVARVELQISITKFKIPGTHGNSSFCTCDHRILPFSY